MNDRLARLWYDPRRTPILIGIIALNAGVGLGYILGKRRVFNMLEEQDEKLDVAFDLSGVRDELDAIRANPTVMNQNIIDEKVMAREIKQEVILEPLPQIIEEDELVTRSIFVNDDDWNFEKELLSRTPSEPYIIHKDEFYAEETEYTQNTLTYYAGDNILVDEDDNPIYNHEQITGPLLFGHGSGDPNVVHIRNDKRKAEYKVCFDPGLYSVEVLGLEIEDNRRVRDLKHSKLQKFRLE